jgi:uncharacterized membrane protein YgcG
MVDAATVADGKRVGYLKKKAGKGPHGFKQWKKRFVSFDGAELSWADSPSSAKSKGAVAIDALWMVRLTDPSTGRFELGSEAEIHSFEAADGAEAREWIELLLRARASRTSRWEDRMLAKVGASAGDRERLRQMAETWQDGHLTLVRERAADKGATDKAAVEKAAAAGVAADALVVGGVRLWSVLHRGTLWLSMSERSAATPLGYVALEEVDNIRSTAGQRSFGLVSARGDEITLSTDTRKLILDWNLKIACVHSALRHLHRAEVLRRMEGAKGRETGPPEAGPPWPPPASVAAAQTAHFAARSQAFTARPAGVGGAGLGGGVHNDAKSYDDLASLRAGRAGAGYEFGARGGGSGDENGYGSDSASVSGRSARGGLAGGPDGLRGGPDAVPEEGRFGDDDDEWTASVEAARARPEGGAATMWWVCLRLPGLVTYYACRCLVPKPVRARVRRFYRSAEDTAAAAKLRAVHQTAELAQKIQAELEGVEIVTGPMLAGPLAPSDAISRVVPVSERRSEAAELHIGSVRDVAGRHLKFRAALIVCGVRIPVSNRWSKRVLGARVSADKEAELWAYARNLARLGLAHARATGQTPGGRASGLGGGGGLPRSNSAVSLGGGSLGGGGAGGRAGRSRLAAAAAARSMPLPTADAAVERGAPAPSCASLAAGGPVVSLHHFLNLCHALPLVPPSGKFFNLDVLAAEAVEGADEPPADADEAGAVGMSRGDSSLSNGAAGGGGGGGAHANSIAVPADSFVAPLLNCREPAASKDAFFKQVPALQKALAQVHRPLAAEIDDAEAARLAAQVLKAWQTVLSAGGGPSAGAAQRASGHYVGYR